MMRLVKIFFLFIILVALLPAQERTSQHDVSIINSVEIVNSGLIRNDYFFSLMNSWDRITTDGYNWSVSANSLSSYQQQNWTLILNGQRMDINSLNSNNINAIPFLLSFVDSVEVLNMPIIYNGEFSSEGLIQVHTSKPKQGFSLYTRVATGNVTGDPGPYVYTEYASDNIEEDGPEFSLALDYGSNIFFGRILLLTETFAASDAAIRGRNEYTDWDSLKIGKFIPSIQLGTNSLNGSHNFFAGYSTSEQQSFYPESYNSNNLLFIKEAVKDYSAHTIFKHAGFNGFFNLSGKTKLNYQLKASGNEAFSSNRNSATYFEQSLSNYLVNAELDFDGIKVGTGYDHSSLEANYSPNKKGVSLFKIYGELPIRINHYMDQKLNIYYLQGNKIGGIKTSLVNHWNPGENFSTTLNLAYTERIPDENRDIWFFVNNGYDLLNELNIDYNIDGAINKSRKFTADLNFSWSMNHNYLFSFGIIYRNFIRSSLESVTAEYVPEQTIFNTTTVLSTNSTGQIVGASVGVKNILSKSLNQEIFYRYQDVIEGDNFFYGEWRTIPTHKIIYKLSFEPFQSFSIWSRITYLSSTNWEGYSNLDETSDGLYSETIKASVVLDIAVRKWFWQERIRLGLLFKNLLNDEVRYHPVSPNFPLSLYFQAELVFSSFYEF